MKSSDSGIGLASLERNDSPVARVDDHRLLRLLPLGITLVTIATIAIHEVDDPDVWWHLATGRYIVQQRRIPVMDVFSFTAGTHRWVTHEWLSDILLYGGYRLFGFAGLALLFAGLIVVAFALVYRRCQSFVGQNSTGHQVTPVLAAASVLLAAVASAVTWGVRPQMFSLFFTSLYLYILDKDDEGSTRVWLLPLLTLLWANLHSGFMAGMAIIAVYIVGGELSWLSRRGEQAPWVDPRVRRLALVGVVSLICSLITPNGLSAALFSFGTLSNRLIQSFIVEWFSPNFHLPNFWPLLAYWLILLVTLAISPQRAKVTQVLLLLGASVATLYSTRHVTFLSLVGAPLLAEQAGALWPQAWASRTRPRRPVSPVMRAAIGVAALSLVVAIGARLWKVYRRSAELEQKDYPAAAIAFMRENGVSGRIFNTYHWGGYLIWQGYPVFVDGRAELYGDEIMDEHMKVHKVKPDWEAPLRDYAIDIVLIESDTPLAVLLKESVRWQAIYRDSTASVFVPAGKAETHNGVEPGG